MNTHTHNRFTCQMCRIENQVMRVEERIPKMDEDRSPETEEQGPQDAEPSQPRRRYAVVYSAGDTARTHSRGDGGLKPTIRIMRTASTSLGAVRQAQSLVEWLTKGEEDGINVTLDGATVQAAAREDVYIWTLVLKTGKNRPARGRISIWREM
jgi:hypothetical protein